MSEYSESVRDMFEDVHGSTTTNKEGELFAYLLSLGGDPKWEPGINWSWIREVPGSVDASRIEEKLDVLGIDNRGVVCDEKDGTRTFSFRYRFAKQNRRNSKGIRYRV